MAIRIVPYTAEHVAAVREFNQRSIEDLQFPESPDPGWLPGMELFVALEDGRDGEQRSPRGLYSTPPAVLPGRGNCLCGPLPFAGLRRSGEPRVRNPGPPPGARRAGPRAPALCAWNGRLGARFATNAQAPALADVRRPVPLQGGPPFPFSARNRRAANYASTAFDTGRGCLQRRRLAGSEDDGARAAHPENQG